MLHLSVFNEMLMQDKERLRSQTKCFPIWEYYMMSHLFSLPHEVEGCARLLSEEEKSFISEPGLDSTYEGGTRRMLFRLNAFSFSESY